MKRALHCMILCSLGRIFINKITKFSKDLISIPINDIPLETGVQQTATNVSPMKPIFRTLKIDYFQIQIVFTAKVYMNDIYCS